MNLRRFLFLVLIIVATIAQPALAQRQMERLGRGVLALRTSSTQVYVSWRLLGNDPEDIAFNLYRSANGGSAVKLNATPLTVTTDYRDTPPSLASTAYTYSVKPVVGGVEVADVWANPLSGPAVLPANPPTRQYIPIPLEPTPDGDLKVGFCWVGDLDGDGEYDFVIVRNNQLVEDSRQFLEAYKRDGTFLWRMDMGPNSTNHYNIEPGSSTLGIGHGDNATVYDLDGDGKAEVLVRTANGVIFGDGATLSAANNSTQFISVVNGMTGVEMARATVPNARLSDGPMNGHMGIVYPDGRRPSVLWAAKNRAADNGFNGNTTVWDYRNGAITQRWSYNADTLNEYAPEAHQIRLGDPDNDGKDEFLDIGYAIDDNGLQLFNIPEIVHGDRFHMADIDPDRPGLETYLIQQNNGTGLATAFIEAGTGKFIKKWYAGGVVDVGRGLAADIDPDVKGLEMFSTQGGIFDRKGVQIYDERPFPPEGIWWDGNLSREFLATVGASAESPAIARFDPNNPGNQSRIYTIYNQTAPGVYWAYGGRAPFWGDILGDWREEVVVVANDNSELRIYATTTSATNRLYTLMHNPQYRIQATTKGYVQGSYTDYYLGDGMTVPPPPPMVDAKLVWKGGTGATTWDVGATQSWLANGANSAFANGDTVRFDIGGNNTTPVTLSGTLQPGALTVYNPKDYAFAGTGVLAGAMKLVKAGGGSLTLPGTHTFTGKTTVWDGALLVNGALQQSPVTVWGGTWGGALAAGKTGGRIGGAGTFGQLVTVKYRGAITPGAGMNSVGTVAFGNGLTMEDSATFAMDLSDDATGTAKPNDRIAVTGNLSLGGKVNIVINPLNAKLGAGTYTLATYTGTLTGSLSNLVVTPPAGTPYTLAAAGGAITLTVPVTRNPSAVIWSGAGGTWDLSASQNWLRNGSPDVFVAGDTVTFNATGSANQIVTLAAAMPVAGLTVDTAGNYTFTGAGSITGAGGLTKAGAGTLTVNTINDYTGPTTIAGGVLAVAALGDAGASSSIGASGAAASNFVINGGRLRLTGSQTNTNRNVTLGSNGGTLDVANGNSSIQISGVLSGSGALIKEGAGTVLLASNNTYAGGTVINGGTIYLAGAGPNVSGLGGGSVMINNGTLTMADVQASETAAWNLIVPSGATARLNADGRCSLTGSLTGAGTFTFYTGFIRTDLKGNWSAFTGRINAVTDDDGGDLRVTNPFGFGTAALNLGSEVNAYYNTTSSSPTLDIGELSGAATSKLLGTPTGGRTVTWRVGGRNTDSTFNGIIGNSTGPAALTKVGTGALTLAPAQTIPLATTTTSGSATVTVGSTAGLEAGSLVTGTGIPAGTRIAAVTDATTLALTKAATATGVSTLNYGAVNTYTGATIVSAGTLALPGALVNANTVEVLSGATLNLTGLLTTGTLTIRAGGRLIGGGTINADIVNEGLIEAANGVVFTFNGEITNNGTMRFLSGAGFTHTGGTFINNGTLDLLTAGAAPIPAAGAGKTYTAADLRVTTFNLAGGFTPTLTLFTLAGHNYQFERCVDLKAPVWTSVGAAQAGSNAAKTFTDPSPPSGGKAFYRVNVSP